MTLVFSDVIKEDNAKRRQIIEGARKVFLADGFSGASMNDIARIAGVSKGTLYTYFQNKEQLFSVIIEKERCSHVINIFNFDYEEFDIEAVLLRVAIAFTTFLTQPHIVSALRVVIGIAEHMPDLGERFYEKGPCDSQSRLATYLDRCVAAGHLDIADTQLAAAQFLEMASAPLVKPMLFVATVPAPDPDRIRAVARSAVRIFMAGYEKSPDHKHACA